MVKNIVWLIFARANSKRLPKKCYKKLGNYIVLERLVNNAIKSGINKNDLFLCTSIDNSCDELVKISKRMGINNIRGDEDYPIKRICTDEAIRKLSIYRNIVRICGDSPFYSFDLAIKSEKAYREKFNDIFCITNTRKRNFPSGLSIEIYDRIKFFELLIEKKFLQNEEHMSKISSFTDYKIIDITSTKDFKKMFAYKLTLDEYKDFISLNKLVNSDFEDKLKKAINEIKFE